MSLPNERPWIIFAGGGTGGHLFPALAVADALRSAVADVDVSFLVTDRPFDRETLGALSEEFVAQTARPFGLKPAGMWRFWRGWRSAIGAARETFEARRPRMVIGSGGYAAGPPVRAAQQLGIPTGVLNPDAVPGRANRHLAGRADHVFIQWSCTRGAFPAGVRVHETGCPIRGGFRDSSRDRGLAEFGLDADRRTLLVTGASQGARSINETVSHLLDTAGDVRSELAETWQVVHLTGAAMREQVANKYESWGVPARVLAFSDRMPEAMGAADLVISRAGASSLAEFTATGCPSILMPYPYHRDQHQRRNAQVLADAGAAILLEDRVDGADNANRLAPLMLKLLGDSGALERMAGAARGMGRPDAAEQVATIVRSACGL